MKWRCLMFEIGVLFVISEKLFVTVLGIKTIFEILESCFTAVGEIFNNTVFILVFQATERKMATVKLYFWG